LTASSVGTDVPAAALEESRHSVGAVVQTAAGLPAGAGADLLESAKAAFVHGSNVANLIAAVVVSIAAVLAFRLLPSGNAGRGPASAAPDQVDGEIALIDSVAGIEGPEGLVDGREPVGR
jgi:DHA2 family multidrug resistance protein-like MFS transporter